MSTQSTTRKDPSARPEACPKCGMARMDWPSEGHTKNNQTYCCKGCADGTGCTCGEDQ